ncbi:hypothetical protein RYZ26_06375 [Terasakiella sp. A23]|uniref:hypothetical protein n=1 Tax=Terasakiella sp. FCG-A23 TaxID=3080561 RepID=UPI0029530F95|nr:hypothetical protein [Terasakiella sp. A23]MDV7339210.1 hypothetical protein [Terasakiella sp. A23]
MKNENDIYKTANQVIEKFGEEAALYAAIRGDEFQRLGNQEGEILWRRITRAVEVLQTTERPTTAVLH